MYLTVICRIVSFFGLSAEGFSTDSYLAVLRLAQIGIEEIAGAYERGFHTQATDW